VNLTLAPTTIPTTNGAPGAVRIELSVVVPVYGCAGCIPELVARSRQALEAIGEPFEIILVDDGSTDGAWPVLAALARTDPDVQAIRLSRNFGQHAAITAGLAASAGRWAIVMDCDLQEPPEEIPRMYAKAHEGFDIVRMVRRERRHSMPRRSAGRLYRWLVMERGRREGYSTLSLVSRKVVSALLRMEDRDREYQLMLDWLGFRQAVLEFAHADRPAGKSSYTLRGLLRVALDGMYFRTTLPLRLVVALGALVAFAGLGLACYEVYSYYAVGSPEGYTTLVVLLLVLSGFIIISLGVVGLYVGRVFEQVRRRPLFIIEERLGGEPRSAPADTADEFLADGAQRRR
jgi:glycosyltransferase involved in cell wall biosynthesis